MSYAQARKDFEYLEEERLLDDAVEIDAMVFYLMREPTKKKAENMYKACISLWFQERHREGYHSVNKKLHAIAERYGCKLSRVGITK